MHTRTLRYATLALSCAMAAPAMAEEARLLRFPDIHRDKVAFVYAGDIWVAPSGGGRAERLTSDGGLELFPKFSPDGRSIAFSAEYSGSRQVFVVGVDGGAPRQEVGLYKGGAGWQYDGRFG